MQAISELFSSTELVLPCQSNASAFGLSPLKGNLLRVRPLTALEGQGLKRKLRMLIWLLQNIPVIWVAVRRADAVHTPIPGDIGTIGMVFSLIQRKRLFVRHCGNWFVQRTVAERVWKWAMEHLAGGRNVMLATGGAVDRPSKRSPHVRWIFSTSLRFDQMLASVPEKQPLKGRLRLIIVCRQEERKGTDIVIACLPLIFSSFPNASLDIVGDGSLLKRLKQQVSSLGLDGHVTFHGKVEQARVLELLRDAHVFCYPTSASEGFPKVVLEALANGLPVITTNVSVLPQLIRSGCGVLLDEPTPAALAAAVTQICSENSEYHSMSLRAKEISRKYSLENWRDQIGEMLRDSWGVADLADTNQVD